MCLVYPFPSIVFWVGKVTRILVFHKAPSPLSAGHIFEDFLKNFEPLNISEIQMIAGLSHRAG